VQPASRADASVALMPRVGKKLPPSDELPMSVQFSVLGPVRAWRGPVELKVGPNQQCAVLALLLVRANQLVPVEDIMELLWEENPPTSAVNVVHKYIGSIRHLLEPGLKARASGRWLTRHGVAYRLAADENMSDLLTFRRIVKDARSAGAANRPADALDLLLEALALRRGACAEGLDLGGRSRNYFAAVDQEYVAAVAEAADTALASGQPLRILTLLRQVAVGESLNEALRGRPAVYQPARLRLERIRRCAAGRAASSALLAGGVSQLHTRRSRCSGRPVPECPSPKAGPHRPRQRARCSAGPPAPAGQPRMPGHCDEPESAGRVGYDRRCPAAHAEPSLPGYGHPDP